MRWQATGMMVATLACAMHAGAQESFDPGKLKGPAGRPPTEVMVLGTAHLSQLPATFRPAALSALNTRLAAWKPAVIAIESVSGTQCAFMRQYPDRYADTVKSYCRWDPAPAQAATGLDVPAATAEAARLLAGWPAAPTPAQRRRLAAVFLAGGEPVSALVQWLRLPAPERRAGDGLDATLVAALEKLKDKRSEDVLIAAPLAAAVGLEQVHTMDDHTADSPEPDEKAYGAAIMKAWDNPVNVQRRQQDERLFPGLAEDSGVLALYRAYNAAGQARVTFDGDFGAALEERSPQQFGRGYVAYWETRNLRMAANIREAAATRPGQRTLVIVGASHKWYLEAYLDRSHDVRIASTDVVLR